MTAGRRDESRCRSFDVYSTGAKARRATLSDTNSEIRHVFIWRKSASADWLRKNEARLPLAHAVIERPGFRRITIECSDVRRAEAEALRQSFGGTIKALPRDWLRRFQKSQAARPLRIGSRLTIVRENQQRRAPSDLVIPAGAAFGTGDHATTAMSLRMLEAISRGRKKDWSMLDLGTGSGIFALAGKCFGAGQVVAVDNDPTAIATAKENARVNGITGIDFDVVDATRLSRSHRFDLITANLYSELLITILPRTKSMLKRNGALILSGILRVQERGVISALSRSRLQGKTIRRRGKWIAILATHSNQKPS